MPATQGRGKGGGDMIDSHLHLGTRRVRARRDDARIKAGVTARRAWTNHDSVLLFLFLHFIEGRPSLPRFDAPAPPHRCRTAATPLPRLSMPPPPPPPPPPPRRDSPPTTRLAFPLAPLAPLADSGSRALRSTRVHADTRASLRIASNRRAPMRTNNLTSRKKGGSRPSVWCSFSHN